MKQPLKTRLTFRISDEINYELSKLRKDEFLNCGELFRNLLEKYLRERKKAA